MIVFPIPQLSAAAARIFALAGVAPVVRQPDAADILAPMPAEPRAARAGRRESAAQQSGSPQPAAAPSGREPATPAARLPPSMPPVRLPAPLAQAAGQAAQRAAVRQAGAAPLMANLQQALESPQLPAPVRAAARNVAALQTRPETLATPQGLKTAVARSGLFLEARLAQPSAAPLAARPAQTDVKGALLALRQVLAPLVANAAAAPNPPTQTAAPSRAYSPLSPAAVPAPAAPAQAVASPASLAAAPVPQPAPPAAPGRATVATPLPDPSPVAAAPAPPAGASPAAPPPPTPRAASSPGPLASPTTPVATPLLEAPETAVIARPAPPSTPPAAARPAPPPMSGAAPSPQPVAVPTLPPAAEPAAIVRALAPQVEAAIARQELLQIASLPTAPAPDEPPAVRWQFEVPLATPQGPAVAGFEIRREAPERDGTGPAAESAPVWRIRFALDLEPLGPIEAVVTLKGVQAGVALWAEREATAHRLAAEGAALTRALNAASFEAELSVRTGRAPQPKPAPGRFLDQAT